MPARPVLTMSPDAAADISTAKRHIECVARTRSPLTIRIVLGGAQAIRPETLVPDSSRERYCILNGVG